MVVCVCFLGVLVMAICLFWFVLVFGLGGLVFCFGGFGGLMLLCLVPVV